MEHSSMYLGDSRIQWNTVLCIQEIVGYNGKQFYVFRSQQDTMAHSSMYLGDSRIQRKTVLCIQEIVGYNGTQFYVCIQEIVGYNGKQFYVFRRQQDTMENSSMYLGDSRIQWKTVLCIQEIVGYNGTQFYDLFCAAQFFPNWQVQLIKKIIIKKQFFSCQCNLF